MNQIKDIPVSEPKIEEIISSGRLKISAVTIKDHEYIITQETSHHGHCSVSMIHAQSCKCLKPETISNNAVSVMNKIMGAAGLPEIPGMPNFGPDGKGVIDARLGSDLLDELYNPACDGDKPEEKPATDLEKNIERLRLLKRPFLSTKQTCFILDIDEDTIGELIKDGRLREFRDAGRVFYKSDQVKAIYEDFQ